MEKKMNEFDEDQKMNKSNYIMDKTSKDKPDKQHQKPSHNEKNGAVKLKQTKNLHDQLNSETPSQLFSSASHRPNKQQGTMPKGNLTVKPDGSMGSQVLQANTDSSEDISIKSSETTKTWPNPKDYGCEQGAINEDTDTVPANQSIRQGPTAISEEKKKRIIVNKNIMHPNKDKKTEEDKVVLRWVFGFLNLKENRKGKLILGKNGGSVKTISTKEFDKWCQGIESMIKESLNNKHIIDFIKIKMKDWNSKVHEIKLSVEPTPNLSTLNYYSYFPCTSSVDEVQYEKAVQLLRQEGRPRPLLPIPNRTYKLNHVVEGLRNENECTQFKEIKGENVLHKLKKLCSRCISAFGNYQGGVIYFGIKDETGKVVGVDFSNIRQNKEANGEEFKMEDVVKLVESAFEERIGGMFYGKPSQKLVRKIHWNIQLFDIEDDGKDTTIMHNTKIIAVSVCKIPGCVFTAVPESYYIDKDEILQRYTFEDWKSKLLKSDKDIILGNSIPVDEILSYSESPTTGVKADEFQEIHTGQRHNPKDLSVNLSEANPNENSLTKRSLSNQLKEKRNTPLNTGYELQESVGQMSYKECQELITKMIEKDPQFVSNFLNPGYVQQSCAEQVQRAEPQENDE